MSWKKISRFWKAGLINNRILPLSVMIVIMILVMAGCNDEPPEVSDTGTAANQEAYLSNKQDCDEAEGIEAVYHDIYDGAVETNTLASPETKQCIVARLGENGYVAVDSENQVDMVRAEQAVEFYKVEDEKENTKPTIIMIKDFGVMKFDLETEDVIFFARKSYLCSI